jgi:hypothetical protein
MTHGQVQRTVIENIRQFLGKNFLIGCCFFSHVSPLIVFTIHSFGNCVNLNKKGLKHHSLGHGRRRGRMLDKVGAIK